MLVAAWCIIEFSLVAGRVTGCERGRRRGRQPGCRGVRAAAETGARAARTWSIIEFARIVARLCDCAVLRAVALRCFVCAFVPCAVGAVMARVVGTWHVGTHQPHQHDGARALRARSVNAPLRHTPHNAAALFWVACRKTPKAARSRVSKKNGGGAFLTELPPPRRTPPKYEPGSALRLLFIFYF